MRGLSTLWESKGLSLSLSPPCEGTARREPSANREAGPHPSQDLRCLHHGLPARRTVRSRRVWFKPLRQPMVFVWQPELRHLVS